MMMQIVLFVFGTLFGSAANALIDRLPRNESWVKGKSHCDKCNKELGWKDLIPIVSYVSLRGRCRYCRSPIPKRNLMVEIIVGLAFVVINWHLLSFNGILLSGILWVTVIIAVMDWETKLVSEKMVVAWGVLTLMLNSPFGSPSLIKEGVGGVLVGVAIIGGIWLITKKKAMGEGDIEIAAVMGWWLGWPNIMIALWVAFVTGAVVGVWQMAIGRAKLKTEIAFGPFLVIGSWMGYMWGAKIWSLIGI